MKDELVWYVYHEDEADVETDERENVVGKPGMILMAISPDFNIWQLVAVVGTAAAAPVTPFKPLLLPTV